MSKESNVEIFNDWLDSEGICDLMSYEALEFKKLLKSRVKALITLEVKKAVDEERDWWIATAPDKYSVERIKQIQDMNKNSHIGTLTQEKNK